MDTQQIAETFESITRQLGPRCSCGCACEKDVSALAVVAVINGRPDVFSDPDADLDAVRRALVAALDVLPTA